MKINIDDMIENIDLSYLDEIEFSDEEIDKLTKGIDFDRVKKITFEQIELKSDNKSQNYRKHINKRFVYKIALAATLILLLGSIVFAYQKGIFEYIFRIDSTLTENEIVRVNKSQSLDGIKMTLADVLQGEKEALVTLVLEKDDRSTFQHPSWAELELYLDNNRIYGSSSWGYSEDKKQLLYTLEFFNSENLQNKKLNIKLKGVYYSESESQNYSINLKEVFDSYPACSTETEQINEDELQNIGRDIDLEHYHIYKNLIKHMSNQQNIKAMPYQNEYEGLSFAGVGISDSGMYIANHISDIEQNNSTPKDNIMFSGLLDSRTDETISMRSSSLYYLDSNSTENDIQFTFFENITEEDLQYLTPIVTVKRINRISNKSFDISYVFDKDATTFNKNVNQICYVEEGDIHIKRLEISVLGVYLYGEILRTNEFDHNGPQIEIQPDIEILLKDGSKIELMKGGSRATDMENMKYHRYQYRVPNQNLQENSWNNFEPIDNKFLNSIEAIILDGKKIEI